MATVARSIVLLMLSLLVLKAAHAEPEAFDAKAYVESMISAIENQGPDKFFSSPTVVNNLLVDEYTGLWYEVASSLSAKLTFEFGCRCTTAEYTAGNSGVGGPFIGVTNSCERFGKPAVWNSRAWPLDILTASPLVLAEARLKVSKNPPTTTDIPGNYWVLYFNNAEGLAVVGGPNAYTSPIFYLSRTQTITPEQNAMLEQGAILAGIPAIRLSEKFLVYTEQFDCIL